MSLVAHAKNEMKLAGLHEPDADYGGMLYGSVLRLIEAHAKERHSGGSHFQTLQIFNMLANFKTLTPITSDPSEWYKVGENIAGPSCWQNKRSPSIFSQDGGQTWYDIDDKKKKNWPRAKWYHKLMLYFKR